MAKTIVITDDIDGSHDARPVAFSFDGSSYEIDLSESNVAAFRELLSPYTAVARRASQAAAKSGRGRAKSTDLRAVREWAAANGHEVSGRGRIRADVVEAYEAAN